MKKIGFFDSGLGGISVLREAVKEMPEESYIYYGDSAMLRTAAEVMMKYML